MLEFDANAEANSGWSLVIIWGGGGSSVEKSQKRYREFALFEGGGFNVNTTNGATNMGSDLHRERIAFLSWQTRREVSGHGTCFDLRMPPSFSSRVMNPDYAPLVLRVGQNDNKVIHPTSVYITTS